VKQQESDPIRNVITPQVPRNPDTADGNIDPQKEK
jgi:hypothetical protein